MILKGLSAWGEPLMETLLTIVRQVRDPRDMNARHCVGSMLFIAPAATLCGAKSAVDIADFGRAHTTILSEIVDLPHCIPSHDCFDRLFRLLDPAELERAVRRFGEALHREPGPSMTGSPPERASRLAAAITVTSLIEHQPFEYGFRSSACSRPGMTSGVLFV